MIIINEIYFKINDINLLLNIINLYMYNLYTVLFTVIT